MIRIYGLLISLFLPLVAFSQSTEHPVEAALANNFVPVTMTFKGSEVTLIGSLLGDGDIIIEVRGLPGKAQVWKKKRVMGIWVNHEGLIFDAIPSFYTISSNRKISDILSREQRRQVRIGVEHLIGNPNEELGSVMLKNWKDALIRNMEKQGRWVRQQNEVEFVGENLFRTTLRFPANAPIGSYEVYIYAIKDGYITSAQSASLDIEKVGILAYIWETAQFNPILYGILSLLAACGLGYGIMARFKKV